MKEKIENILRGIFSLFIMIAMLGGGIVFLMFLLGLILGGELGRFLAITAKDIMVPYFIRSASIAVLAGLILSYHINKHGLSL